MSYTKPEIFEPLVKSIKCTIPYEDDEVKTLWDYLQSVHDIHRGKGENLNPRTLVRFWGKDIHPLYADYLIVYTAEDLVMALGVVKDTHDTPAKLKVAYAEALKSVGKGAPVVVKILRNTLIVRDEKTNEECEVDEKTIREVKNAQHQNTLALYVIKYLLLGKPFNLATEVCYMECKYTLHEWYGLTRPMECWDEFVKERHERRHSALGKCAPKDTRPASYLLDDAGFNMLTEAHTHDLMRSIRRKRKGKHPLVSKDENDMLYPVDWMDFDGKKWSGIILTSIVVKGENEDLDDIDPRRDEIIHTMMWDVFGEDTTKLECKQFSVLFFNNQRRRDLAYEWMQGEPVVYDK